MGDEPDLDPEISRSFFVFYVLKLDPSLLTENGIRFAKQNSLQSSVSESKYVSALLHLFDNLWYFKLTAVKIQVNGQNISMCSAF